MMAALYLQVSIVSQALIFVTRSRGWSFLERPGLLLVSAFVIAQLVSEALFPHNRLKSMSIVPQIIFVKQKLIFSMLYECYSFAKITLHAYSISSGISTGIAKMNYRTSCLVTQFLIGFSASSKVQ